MQSKPQQSQEALKLFWVVFSHFVFTMATYAVKESEEGSFLKKNPAKS